MNSLPTSATLTRHTSTEGFDLSIAKLFSRRFLASAVAIPVVAGGLVLVTPGVAEAAPVVAGWAWDDYLNDGGSYYPC